MNLQGPVSVSFPIQWGDQDMFGHVNNVHFLKWFESGRVSYLMQCGARLSNAGVGPILAAIQCDYVRQIKYPDTITVGTSLGKIGNSSLVLHHELWSQTQNEVAARGDSTVVMFDYVNQKPVRVPDDVRAAIKRLEQSA